MLVMVPPTLLSFSLLSPQTGYTADVTTNNTSVKSEISTVHYRTESKVRFHSRVLNRDLQTAEPKPLKASKVISKSKRSFENIPRLSECRKSKTEIDKKRFDLKKESLKNFSFDLLFYDPTNAVEVSSAELWPETAIPYRLEEPNAGMRLGLLNGLECLPTRIVLTERGLEKREGNSAWKAKSKELSSKDSKELYKQLKQVRTDYK